MKRQTDRETKKSEQHGALLKLKRDKFTFSSLCDKLVKRDRN